MATKTKEKDYLAVAKKSVTTAKEIQWQRKILVYSRHKKGKTTFAKSAGKRHEILFIDPEYGTNWLTEFNPYVWHVQTWEQLQDVYGALRTGKLSPFTLGKGPEKEPFKWVVVDGMTRINNMALRYVGKMEEERDLSRRPGMVDRRDYNKSGELMKGLIINFHNLPMGVIYTAQERIIGNNDGDEDEGESSVFIVPDLPQGVRGTINSFVDVIGRLYVAKAEFKVKGKDETVTKMQRRLLIGNHDRYETGARSEFELPEIVKSPTVPKLLSLMAKGETTSSDSKKGR